MKTTDPKDFLEEIQGEMAALNREEWLQSGIPFDNFVSEFSQTLAQATEDEAALSAAGFDAEQIPKYYGYLRALSSIHGERVVAEGRQAEAQAAFSEKLAAINSVVTVLLAVCRFIVRSTGNEKASRVYQLMRKGNTISDKLNDVFPMVEFIRENAKVAQHVHPGGIVVDDAYLTAAETSAAALIRLRGKALNEVNDTHIFVARQNQLLTLCIRAQRLMKLYAEMAFYDDLDYYTRHYTSDTVRKKNARRRNEAKGKGDRSDAPSDKTDPTPAGGKPADEPSDKPSDDDGEITIDYKKAASR